MNTISRAAYDGNIVSRLRNWRGLHLAHGGDLFEEAAAEIERLLGDAEVGRLRLEAAHAEIERLQKIIEDYARSCAASSREINDLRKKIKQLKARTSMDIARSGLPCADLPG